MHENEDRASLVDSAFLFIRKWRQECQNQCGRQT
ncbi:MAG: hypothetical protein RLY70_1277 [Planctomycetota bacterium]